MVSLVSSLSHVTGWVKLSYVLGYSCNHHGHPGTAGHFPGEESFSSALAFVVIIQLGFDIHLHYLLIFQVFVRGCHFCCSGDGVHGVHKDILPHAPPHQDHPHSLHLAKSQEYLQKLFWNLLYKRHK